jgi:glycosyltransferase involved in cell wall biosynthesis
VPVFRYPVPDRPTRDEARGRVTVRGAEHFHRWLEQQRPDIVHVHTFVTGLGLPEVAAARRAGARVIATSHAASLGFVCERGTLLHLGRGVCDGRIDPVRCTVCALDERRVPRPLAGLVARLPSALAARASGHAGRAGTLLGFRALIDRNRVDQRTLLESVSAFVVLSRYAADVVVANGAPPDKVIVNRLGVAPRAGGWPRKPGPDERPTSTDVTLGFVGRAEAIKGLEDVVRAVASLPRGVRVRLRAVVVAASRADHAMVDRCRAIAGTDARIVIEPAVPPRAMPALLASIDALVCPSRVIEGGPTVALEAFAVGTPVIGAHVPALSEIVETGVNGILYPVADWRALARTIHQVAADPAGTIDRWRIGIRPPRTLDEVADDYERLYARAR